MAEFTFGWDMQIDRWRQYSSMLRTCTSGFKREFKLISLKMTNLADQLASNIQQRDLLRSRENTDRMFASMMVLQAIAGLIIASIASPYTWYGVRYQVHVHVWIALGLGSLLALLPVLMAWKQPGAVATRHVIAFSQMCFGAMFIHFSGGRIETHFHVFVSLACLAYYQDWRVLATATVVTALDHFLRGFLWPQSVFGIATASPWRAIEHATWVILEDVFLFIACSDQLRNLRRAAKREAEVEVLKQNFELQVGEKTKELLTACETANKALGEITSLRYALDHHALLSIADRAGHIVDANAGFCRVSGYSQAELLGKDHRMLNSGFHPKSFWIDMWKSISKGNPWRNEVCNRAKDGSLYWVDSTIIPQMGPDGKVERYVSLRFDITDKKRAEESLRIANQRYQLLAAAAERSPDSTIVTDLKGIVRLANPAARELDTMFGFSVEVGSAALFFTEGKIDPAIRQELVEKVVNEGAVFHAHLEARFDNSGLFLAFGEIRSARPQKVLSITASPLVNEVGIIDGILLAKRDITEDVVRQRSLEEITSAMDAATDCVFILDAESHRFVYVNQGALKQVGYDMSEMLNMTVMDINPTLEQESFRAMTTRLQWAPSTAINFRSEHRHRDGHRVPVEISLQFIPHLGGSGRYLAIVRDIAERIATEGALEAAKEQAELSSRSKSEFLANMSHEIRTPMTAILGYADLLDTEESFSKDSALAINAIHTIRSNAKHLITIINDILDMSKIEAGRMSVEQIEISPSQIVEEVLTLMKPRSEGKGLALRLQWDSPIPKVIKTDPTRLRQILLNLLGNAIKFTEVGGVTLVLGYDKLSNRLQASVVDTGIGMSTAQCEFISRFDAFSQADGSMTRRFGGTGLGLRISNSLAQMLGGDLKVFSQRGVGSTFALTVSAGDVHDMELVTHSNVLKEPTEIVLPEAKKLPLNSELNVLEGISILLAEDGPDNQRLISFHLKKAGAEVVIAENGLVAVELIEMDEERFDFIFMDMQMPELDGYEATRRLRSWGYKRPIIALTAHAMENDRQKCIDAGCSGYITKPINRDLLIEFAAANRLSPTSVAADTNLRSELGHCS